MKKIFILGGNSFVAKELYNLLKTKEDCFLVSKKTINFLDPNTFSNINFNSSIIIDCVNINNGNEAEIMACNFFGFTSFCEYLKKNASAFKYIYISTISVLSNASVSTSTYVRSKKMAEDYLLSSSIEKQIFRLSYPIGKGENSTRLISRLINNLKNNAPIFINNILLNLNDIEDVVQAIHDKLNNSDITFISSNQYYYLSDMVSFLKEILNSKSIITVSEVHEQFQPLSQTPFIPKREIKKTLAEMI